MCYNKCNYFDPEPGARHELCSLDQLATSTRLGPNASGSNVYNYKLQGFIWTHWTEGWHALSIIKPWISATPISQ